jgi:GNAT superfamily N-acetyltransferase
MILAALAEAAARGELLLVPDGMCRLHRRRDGRVVIREILVLPVRRRSGVGRRLVEEVIARTGGAPLQARCPVKYEAANLFWPALGFRLAGAAEEINLWELPASA